MCCTCFFVVHLGHGVVLKRDQFLSNQLFRVLPQVLRCSRAQVGNLTTLSENSRGTSQVRNLENLLENSGATIPTVACTYTIEGVTKEGQKHLLS